MFCPGFRVDTRSPVPAGRVPPVPMLLILLSSLWSLVFDFNLTLDHHLPSRSTSSVDACAPAPTLIISCLLYLYLLALALAHIHELVF